MNYRDTFTNDIFISYAHVDNLPAFHQERGWIEQFCEDLRILLVQRMGRMEDVKIWWDKKRLDGGTVFDTSIENGINQSAIFLCLLSQGYMRSDYCQKELDTFYHKAQKEPHGLVVNEHSRLQHVLLYDIPFKEWPTELAGKSGYRFFQKKDEEELGWPVDVEDDPFRDGLRNLSDALVTLITDMRDHPPPPPTPPSAIFFGDVSDSLRKLQKRTVAELKKQGYTIVWDVPPPYEKEEHEEAVKEKINASILNVHLLDGLPGREVEGDETIWYPQKQVEIGLLTEKPQLIWMPAETNVEVIEEEQYKAFLQGLENNPQATKKIDFVRGAKSELTRQITEMVEQLKREQEQGAAHEAVLLETHLSDKEYAWMVGERLKESGIETYLNSVEDSPLKNANTQEDRISKVNKMIFLYGKATWDWVKGRMTTALQSIITNFYPVEEFIVFLAPPHKNPGDISLRQWVLKVNVVNNSDTTQLDPTSLHQFIESIKKHNA